METFSALNQISNPIFSVFVFFCMFCFIHLVADSLLSLENLSKKDRILFCEKINSSLNAIVLGSSGLYLVFYQDIFKYDLIYPFPPLLKNTLFFFLAYDIYDLITMIYSADHWSMWVHHFITLASTIALLIQQQGTFWVCVFTITEFPALTNNLWWYTRLYTTSTYQSNESSPLLRDSTGSSELSTRHTPPTDLLLTMTILRFVSFFCFRIWVAPFCIYVSLTRYNGFYGFMEQMSLLPIGVSFPIVFCTLMLFILNLVWTFVMGKSTLKAIEMWLDNRKRD